MRREIRAKAFDVMCRYGLSVATVGAALLLTQLFWRWIEPQATPLFLVLLQLRRGAAACCRVCWRRPLPY